MKKYEVIKVAHIVYHGYISADTEAEAADMFDELDTNMVDDIDVVWTEINVKEV